MSLNRLLTAAAAIALMAGAANAQTPTTATAKTEAAAQAATGKATTDKPSGTRVQGAAEAVNSAAPATGSAAAATTSTGSSAAQVAAKGDIVETLRASGQFTTLLKAADATNLTGVLKSNRSLTVFAPTDAAFAALPAGELDRLMADKAALQKLLTHHVINAPVDSAKIKGARGPVPSVAQDNVLLDGSEATLKADGATIVQADVRATNGIVHVVDRVLRPGQGGSDQAATGGASNASAASSGATGTTAAGGGTATGTGTKSGSPQ